MNECIPGNMERFDKVCNTVDPAGQEGEASFRINVSANE